MKSNRRRASTVSFSMFLGILLTLTFQTACQDHFDRDDAGRQAQAQTRPVQVFVENGYTVLALDSPTQGRLGLEVATLAASLTRAEVTVPAAVLAVQDLATFRTAHVATQAQLQKSKVEAGVARKEYTRLKTLFEQNQNISEKALQSAEGALRVSEVDVHAEEQQLNLQESIVRQEWGSVVAKWAVESSPELERLFGQSEVLVQITMASDATSTAPKTISLEIPGATRTEARLVSTFPRVDPRIQGRSFLYVADARTGLAPGVNLVAHLSVSNTMKGFIVPTSAVVWSEGKAWVYQQTAANRFARRAVRTDVPIERGFFVTEQFSPGDKLVLAGAQALLSEELLLHSQGGGESDVD